MKLFSVLKEPVGLGRKHIRCSFCGKSKEQVNRLISGPSVYICNECVDLCNEILAEESSRVSPERGT